MPCRALRSACPSVYQTISSRSGSQSLGLKASCADWRYTADFRRSAPLAPRSSLVDIWSPFSSGTLSSTSLCELRLPLVCSARFLRLHSMFATYFTNMLVWVSAPVRTSFIRIVASAKLTGFAVDQLARNTDRFLSRAVMLPRQPHDPQCARGKPGNSIYQGAHRGINQAPVTGNAGQLLWTHGAAYGHRDGAVKVDEGRPELWSIHSPVTETRTPSPVTYRPSAVYEDVSLVGYPQLRCELFFSQSFERSW